jgi:hypothetical protein
MFQSIQLSSLLKGMAVFSPARRTTFLPAVCAIGIAIALLSPTPAVATDGNHAVQICIDSTAAGARCAWGVNAKGEIDICNRTGCVTCPGPTAECTVAKKSRPHPSTSLPAGSTVTTTLGTFKVKPHAFTGSLLKVPPEETKAESKQ